MIAVLQTKLYIYNMNDLDFIEGLDTYNNPFGLCSMNTDSISTIIAYPNDKIGVLTLYHFGW